MKSRKGPVLPQDRAGATIRSGPPRWWRHPASGSALLALLLYLPAVRYAFVRDDRELFVDNPFLRQSGYLLKLLTSDFWSSTGAVSGLWRPLVSLSYWVDGRLGGWLPLWFHTVNVISNAGATALVALLMVEAGAGIPAAWIAASWFAVMTAHVEPVAWISGRTDVWCALFGLLALWLHERGERARPRRGWRAAAAAAFALALLSKESAVTLVAPLAMLASIRHARASNRVRAVALEVAPWVVLAVVWAVAHQSIAPGAMAPTPGWPHPTLPERVWTALAMLPSQLAFLLPGFPHGPDWWIAPARSAADPRVAIGVALHAAAIVLMVRGAGSKSRIGAAAILLWLPIALVSLVVLSRGVLVQGARNMYLPSVGAAWLVGVGGWKLWRRGLAPSTLPRAILPIGLAALLAVSVYQSLIQLAGWRTNVTMYRAMVHAQPLRADGHLGLALTWLGEKKLPAALKALEIAESIDSTRYEIATYRAAIATSVGDWPETIRWTRNAIRRGATESDPWLMEINALQELKLLPWSRTLVETLMVRDKSNPDVAAAFGRQMLAEDTPARAVKPLEYAVGWNPNDASLHMLLADAYVRVGLLEKAREEFRRAIGLRPGNWDLWLRLATVLHELGDIAGRDQALQNAASCPGADVGRVQEVFNHLAGEIREQKPKP